MRRSPRTVLFVALLQGLSITEQSSAYRTVPQQHARCQRRSPSNRSVREWLPPTNREFTILYSSADPSVCKTSAPSTISSSSLLRGAIRLGLLGVGAKIIIDNFLSKCSFGSINSIFKNYPFLVSFLICAVKASSADCLAQFMSFRKNPQTENTKSSSAVSSFSFKRNLALLCYGGFYQGCGQELIYNNLFSTLFGTGTQLSTVATKVCFDQLLIQPLVSLPIAYAIKAPIFGHSLRDSIKNYVGDIKERNLLKKCWMVWTPTQILTFTVVPTHFRITFMACVSFFWIIMFSSISSSSSKEENLVNGLERMEQ